MAVFWVYLLASKRNGTLYVGRTEKLEERIRGHKAGLIPGFTARYGVTQLVYYEEQPNFTLARQRELTLKKWLRQWKINLIEKNNPEWRDLAADWVPRGKSDLR